MFLSFSFSHLKVRSLFTLVTLFSLAACSPPKYKYYSDNTYLVRLRSTSEAGISQLSSKSFLIPGQEDKIILRRKSPTSEIDWNDEVGPKNLIEQNQYSYDYWMIYDPSSANRLSLQNMSENTASIPLGKAWDKAYEESEKYYRSRIVGNSEIRLSAFEPNLISDLDDSSYTQPANKEDASIIANYPSEVWGYGKSADGNPIPDWYYSDEYSQLNSAKAIISTKNILDTERVSIAHLDTGFNSKDSSLIINPTVEVKRKYNLNQDFHPEWQYGEFLIDHSKNFFKNTCKGYPNLPIVNIEHGECPSHGSKTLSVLSGGNYEIHFGDDRKYTGTIGGNPFANVVEYRIKDGVVHLRTSEMTNAIYEAVNNKVDVISMSAGGLPSEAQRDAVNLAYENGVAIFAATGDYFKLPFLSILGFNKTPSLVGFPARYNRVMAVAGTTYDYASYGDDPYNEWVGIFRNGFSRSKWASWMLRGNYGPKAIMYPGKAVSAYAPNVMHSEPPENESDSKFDNSVSLDGGGTSYSTPQVAAAASIWLQLEREAISKAGKWNSWEKAEAVYRAISVCSADTSRRPANMTDTEFQIHFGAGHLKAMRALDFHFPSDPRKLGPIRPRSAIGYTWIYDLITSMRKDSPIDLPMRKLQASMMALEAMQFASIDQGLAKTRNILDQCLYDTSSSNSNICKDKAIDFLQALAEYPEISQTLRAMLEKALANNEAILMLDKHLKKHMESIQSALKDTDPNRCDLAVNSLPSR